MRRILFIAGVMLLLIFGALFVLAIVKQSYLLGIASALAQGASWVFLLAAKFSEGFLWQLAQRLLGIEASRSIKESYLQVYACEDCRIELETTADLAGYPCPKCDGMLQYQIIRVVRNSFYVKAAVETEPPAAA